MIREQWRLLLTAVQFLTRVPVPAWVGHGPGQMDRAARYLPLAGIGVGLVAAAVFTAASAGLSPLVSALLSIAATLLLTGALHEDGLADTIDGLFGAVTRDDALRIMRDSRIGAYGATGLMTVLILKAATTAALPDAAIAIIAAHACSRFLIVCVIAGLPYARTDGKAAAVAGIGHAELAIAGLCGLLPLVLLGPRALPAVLLAVAVAWALARWFRRRLGGYTGDGLGTVQQMTELAILLATAWHAA